MLSAYILEEQFSFLQNWKIHDPVVLAQESLHSTKSKHSSAIALNIDLLKAYDCVSQSFIRMFLI